jgi:hypothetical protein
MRVEIYITLLLLATGTALWFGSRGEKWVGASVLAGNALTFVVERNFGSAFGSVLPVYLFLDSALAVLLCAIAVRFPSWVAICVAAFQINGVLGHLVKLLAPQTISFSYAFLLKVWAWPMLLLILISRRAPGLHMILESSQAPSLFGIRGSARKN